MNLNSKHNRQFIHKTKNGKKIKYELDHPSKNKQKEKREENPRNKIVKDTEGTKERTKAVKKAKEKNNKKLENKENKENKEKNYEKLQHQKRKNTKNKLPNTSQNKIEEVSDTMIINMIAHNRLTKKKTKINQNKSK